MTISPEQLLDLARNAAKHAYAPYSNFPVGAAILTTDGMVFTGCNVENASFGLTLCAERNAVTTMVAATDSTQKRDIAAVAIVGLIAKPCWPCGACRQVLREFNCRTVIVEGPDGSATSLPFAEILPHSFGPDQLSEA